jgi:hypothetical protein
VSDDIRSESRVQIQNKTVKSFQSIRIRLDGLQWEFMQHLKNGEPASSGFCDNACEEMRSLAMELVDAADGLEAGLNG